MRYGLADDSSVYKIKVWKTKKQTKAGKTEGWEDKQPKEKQPESLF